MEATTIGLNRTGAKLSPAGTQAMNQATNELAPPGPIDTAATQAERLVYINEAEAVGSIPPPASMKGVPKAGMARLKGAQEAQEGKTSLAYRQAVNAQGSPSEAVAATYSWTPGTELMRMVSQQEDAS